MLKYCATVLFGVVLITLVAMAVVHYIEVSVGTDAAIISGYIVGPVALLAMGMMMALLDAWRSRLAVARMGAR